MAINKALVVDDDPLSREFLVEVLRRCGLHVLSACDGRAGLDIIESFNDRTYTKPSFQLTVTDEFDKSSRLSVSLLKEYTVNAYTEDLFNHWQASVSFNRQVFQRLNAGLSAFYGEGKYASRGIEDELKGCKVSFDYDLLRDAKLFWGYTYSRTDSNSDTRDYARNFYSAGIKAVF